MARRYVSGGKDVKTKCENRIAEYLKSDEKKTAVLVTGRFIYARKTCTRGIVMFEGKIIFDGELEDAIQAYKDKYGKRPKVIVEAEEEPDEVEETPEETEVEE